MSEGHMPAGLDSSSVARAVAGLSGWPFGPIHIGRLVRIGAEHGLSGTAHRVMARTEAGKRVTFVVKEERVEGVERALAFHAAMGNRLRGSIPGQTD